jgi:hypothetical protein
MKIKIKLTAILLFPIMAFAQNMNQGEMLSKHAFYQIPLTQTKNGIHEMVTIRGQKFNFIFDTGAPLCISKTLQEKYKFPVIDTAQLSDSNNKHDTTFIVQVDTISFGGMVFVNIPAVVLDFGNSPIKDQSIQGLLGSNVVRFLAVKFDLKNKLITFTNDNSKLDLETHSDSPLIIDKQSDAYMVIKLNNTFTDTAHFDSGMGGLYHMNLTTSEKYINSFTKKVILKSKTKHAQRGMLGDGVPEEQLKLKVQQMYIGRVTLENKKILTTPAKSRIGRELLNYGILVLDYKNSRYWFY